MDMNAIEILNDRQKEAALTIEGPVLILAGAGSGKTRVLTNRTAYMIEEAGINPWNILAITFTNKAAKEMRTRIDDIVGYGSESIWVSTFHSTCVRILRRHIDFLGYETNFTIYDTDDSKSVMKDVVKRFNIDTKQYPEKSFLRRISKAKDELLRPEDIAREAGGDYGELMLAKVYAAYQDALMSNNALDFDDLIMKTVELFRNFPAVLENYQERFRYLMVDEYQDTNTAQFELIRLLASKYRNICVVGDDDQSIYKFRGANIRNILDFENVWPDAKVVKLEQNYRSTQIVLDAANSVIAHNIGRKSKALWTSRGGGDKIEFSVLDSAYEEAEFIVNSITRAKKHCDADYRDNAVLYRTNAQSRILEEKFIMAGVPYSVVGGVNFYSRKEIKDILAYLKTIDNGKDDLAVKRIINVPKRGIGATTISKISDYAQEHDISFFEAVNIAEDILGHNKAADKLLSFADMINVFRSKLEYITLEQLMVNLLETIEYEQMIKESDDENADERIENIDELVNKVIAYEDMAEEKPTLSDFLEEVALVSDIDNVDSDADRVLLMTLHSAKGLEFPNVYLAGMEDGLFPSYMSICADDPLELEEERRLCYVGITRAMKHLTITAARCRMIRGETQYNTVSRFVKEIPQELFEGRVSFEKPGKAERDYINGYGNINSTSTYKGNGRTMKERAEAARPYMSRMMSENKLTKGSELTSGVKPDYDAGDRIRHVKFGDGTVLSIVKGTKDYEVTVDFDDCGLKKMLASFAKLKKL